MNIHQLHAAAEDRKIPLRTLDQVRTALQAAQEKDSDAAFASLMLKAGRLTPEARAFVESWGK